MGDELASLPEVPTQISPQEEQVLSAFFGGGTAASSVGGMNWKLVGGVVVAFAVLANPWIDSVLCNIPYCSNSAACFGLKAVLFLLIVMVLFYFM